MHRRATLAGLALLLPAGAVPGEGPPSLDVDIEVAPPPPRGPSLRSVAPPSPLTRTTQPLTVDGVFDEPFWSIIPPLPSLPGIRNEAPPHPEWSVRVAVAPEGLAIALGGVGPDATGSLSVDPDGARLGWVAVALSSEQATAKRCSARASNAELPFPIAWRVATRPCSESVPAAASHGPDGWEVLVPWSTLGRTTDDIQLQGWLRDADHTASLDRGRGATVYTGGGRQFTLVGEESRVEAVAASWNRSAPTAVWTLTAKGLAGAESWAWEVHYNGEALHRGTVLLEPENGRATASITLPVQAQIGTGIRLWRQSREPVTRGTHLMPWNLTERATVATPVHRGVVELRYDQTERGLPVRLTVRSEDGILLAEEDLELPRGEGRIRFSVPEAWPDSIQIQLGHLFVEGWLPSRRAASAARSVDGVQP